jgi:hypothetical protein
MSHDELLVNDGPGKPDLLRAVTNANDHLHVLFHAGNEPVEAHVDVVEEIGAAGTAFGLRGRIASGTLRGAMFSGVYDAASRTGKLMLRRA